MDQESLESCLKGQVKAKTDYVRQRQRKIRCTFSRPSGQRVKWAPASLELAVVELRVTRAPGKRRFEKWPISCTVTFG